MLKLLYDLAMHALDATIHVASLCLPARADGKLTRFVRMRTAWQKDLAGRLHIDPAKPTVWLHSASLGEFGIARPIIGRIAPGCNVVLTFFSPSGYYPAGKRYDNVFALPADTGADARFFLDVVKPDVAVFMVSELWHNFLGQLQHRRIPALLVSAHIRPGSVFYKWYGADHRRDLKSFDTIFTVDEASAARLSAMGIASARHAGDPLFDNAGALAASPYRNSIIEAFAGTHRVFVAGSLHADQDLDLAVGAIKSMPGLKTIVVPHEPSAAFNRRLEEKLGYKPLYYSQCHNGDDLAGANVLVIDYVGDLAYIYRYATCSYVGGGFTPLLHSLIEPLAYGVPVAFGPNCRRKAVAAQIQALGLGRSVSTAAQLTAWLSAVDDADTLASMKTAAKSYFSHKSGASQAVAHRILKLCNVNGQD